MNRSGAPSAKQHQKVGGDDAITSLPTALGRIGGQSDPGAGKEGCPSATLCSPCNTLAWKIPCQASPIKKGAGCYCRWAVSRLPTGSPTQYPSADTHMWWFPIEPNQLNHPKAVPPNSGTIQRPCTMFPWSRKATQHVPFHPPTPICYHWQREKHSMY